MALPSLGQDCPHEDCWPHISAHRPLQLLQTLQIRLPNQEQKTSAPVLTRKRWNDLVTVNAYSNNTVAPFTDQEIYNTEEYWAYPTSYGDCEDYVLMKRHMLMEKGWPASSLLITVVRQPSGEGHAVLTVRTDKADYILDNLNSKILPWNKTPYTYLKRQDVHHSGRWADITDQRTPS